MNTDLIMENARLQGRVITLEAEVKCLEAVVRAHQRLDCLQVKDLNAENARLKAEVERLSKKEDYFHDLLNQYALDDMRLTAQVERLTKAGDAMIDEWWLQLSCPERMKASWMQEQAIVDWLAAKEGKQP